MTWRDTEVHPYVPTLLEEVKAGRLDRREFLRTATLLGLSAASSYALLGLEDPLGKPAAAAAGAGGTVRFSMRISPLDSPATYSWGYDADVCRQVCDYLTRTGVDNITRPWL